MKGLLVLFVAFMFVLSAEAQYTAELRHIGSSVEDGVELHVTPRPDMVIVSLASHIKPDLVTTGSESVEIIDQWPEREAYGYEGRHYVITKPLYSHIGNAYVDAPMLTIGAAGLDGQGYQQWSWLLGEDAVPAWDAELRAMIEVIENALQQLQEDLTESEIARGSAEAQITSLQAERDQAVAAVAPLQAQVTSLQTQVGALNSDLELAKSLMRALIDRLPPGLRP